MMGAIQGGMSVSSDMMARMREQMFARLDGDGDGQIDLSQLTAEAEGGKADDVHFSRMLEDLTAADTDGDGLVSQTEFEAMEPPQPPPPPPDGGREFAVDEEMSLLDFLYTDRAETTESETGVGNFLNILS